MTMFFRIQIFPALLVLLFPSTVTAASEPKHLTLEAAVARALRYNRNLRNNTLDLDSSRLNLDASRDVFDIKVSPLSSINYSSTTDDEDAIWRVGGQIAKKFRSGIDLKLEPSVEKGNDDYGAGVGFSLAVPLLRGLGTEVTMDSVYTHEYTLASSHSTLHRYKVNTILDTITAVYALIREQHLVSLYADQLRPLKGHLQSAIIRERAGIGRSMDVYRVEIRIKEVEESLSLARERVIETGDRLKDIVALPLDQPIHAKAPLEYTLITMKTDQAVRIALVRRIEIYQGKADITEAMRREKVARHNTLPDLKLETAYTRRGRSSDFDQIFLFEENLWTIGLTSSTDLTRSAEKTAWANSRLALNRRQLNFDTSQQNIIREVRTVLNSLDKSQERITLRREQIIQATGKHRLAHIKFQYNEADNFDLIEAQAQLERAKVNLVSDEIRYIVDGYRLRAAMGTLIAYTPGTTP